MIFRVDSESELKTNPNHVKNQILSRTDFYGTSTLNSPYGILNRLVDIVIALALPAAGIYGAMKSEKNIVACFTLFQDTETRTWSRSKHYHYVE